MVLVLVLLRSRVNSITIFFSVMGICCLFIDWILMIHPSKSFFTPVYLFHTVSLTRLQFDRFSIMIRRWVVSQWTSMMSFYTVKLWRAYQYVWYVSKFFQFLLCFAKRSSFMFSFIYQFCICHPFSEVWRGREIKEKHGLIFPSSYWGLNNHVYML